VFRKINLSANNIYYNKRKDSITFRIITKRLLNINLEAFFISESYKAGICRLSTSITSHYLIKNK
jgi:dTDP-4-dehydrorhamnose 3,5-epimerase-like enzyme